MRTSDYLKRIAQRNAHGVQLGEELKRERDAKPIVIGVDPAGGPDKTTIVKAAIESGRLVIIDCRTPKA